MRPAAPHPSQDPKGYEAHACQLRPPGRRFPQLMLLSVPGDVSLEDFCDTADIRDPASRQDNDPDFTVDRRLASDAPHFGCAALRAPYQLGILGGGRICKP